MDMSETNKPLSAKFIFLLAVATGGAVASNYYAQPLLHTIALSLQIDDALTGLIITAAQISYAIGLLALVPLGDVLERKRLIISMLLLAVAGLLISAFSQNIVWLLAGTIVAGFFSAVAQVIVPFAAALAKDSERGRVVGVVMGGLLLGVLFARIAAGFASQIGSWRSIYMAAAVMLSAIALLLYREIPFSPASSKMSYKTLLISTLSQFAEHPKLILFGVLGALNFAVFSFLWTPSALMLSSKPYYFNDAIIGLFGLAGVAGAFMAPYAGRWADKGKSSSVMTLGFVLLAFSWLPIYFAPSSIVLFIIGIVALDMAAQVIHISTMSQTHKLNANSRSRLNACYMVCHFLGGAAGSFASTRIFVQLGWTGITAAGVISAFAGFTLCAVFFRMKK
ncbi:MAG: MFS transporter [Zoogloeaceae bacterium]|jgi:predicted MFS family arabinose efflux permease|nr:MFS transporter [Zoogloeaceae bacterium]